MALLVMKVLTLRNLTLAVFPEVILATKLFPEYCSSLSELAAIIFTCFVVNYGIWAIVWMYLWPCIFSPLRHVPGPKELITALHRLPFIKDRFGADLFLNLAQRYPGQDLVSLSKFGGIFLVARPRLLPYLCVQRCYDFGKPANIASFVRSFLGNSLPMLEEDEHRFLRKNTMPAFNFRNIRNLYPMMWKKAELFTKKLGDEINQKASRRGDQKEGRRATGVVEFHTWACNITLDVIGVAGMGHEFRAIEKGHDPLVQAVHDFLEPAKGKIIYWLASAMFGSSMIKMLPWNMHGVFDDIKKSANDVCLPLIAKKREAIAKSPDDHFDVLSILIKSGNFSDADLNDQLLTTLAAGQETTASSVTWACYLLAKYPDLQVKLREEVNQACLGLSALELGHTLEQLPYLNGILLETLRLYPSIPTTMRQCRRDTELGGYFISKGTMLIVSCWTINRLPEIWGEDAAICRPERWINEDGKPNQTGGTKSNYNFITFLHGPRSCIGGGFAKAELRCLLATMVSTFSWELVDSEEKFPQGILTIRPKNGLKLRFTTL